MQLASSSLQCGDLGPSLRQEPSCRRSQQPQRPIRRQRQQRRRNCPGQHQPVIHRSHAAKNQLAQPARAHRRRNRRNAHAGHRRRPQPRQDERRRQRQLHFEQSLPSVSPSARATSITAGSMPRIPAYVLRRIGSSAYAVSATIAMRAARSPSHGSGSRKPNIASEGMVCSMLATANHRPRPSRRARKPDSRRNRNRRSKQHGRSGQPQVLQRQRRHLASVLRKEPGLMRSPRQPRFAVRDETPARMPRPPADAMRRNSSGLKIGNQPALAQQHNPIRQIQRLVQIVRHQQHSLLPPAPSGRAACPASRCASADRARRTARPSAGYSDRQPVPAPTPPAAAVRRKAGVEIAGENSRIKAHVRQQRTAAPAPFLEWPTLCLQHQANIALHREMRKQPSLLNHVPHAPPQLRSRRNRAAACRPAESRRQSAPPCDSPYAAASSCRSRCGPESQSWCLHPSSAKCHAAAASLAKPRRRPSEIQSLHT